MSDLDRHLEDYLRLRRLFGYKLVSEGYLAAHFVGFLAERGAATVTVDLAVEWVQRPVDAKPIWLRHRMRAIRGFADYLHTIDPATEVPARDLFDCRAVRPDPYIYNETEIVGILQATRQLRPLLRATLYETMFGLLAVSGMRIGEAIGLRRDDVDLGDGVLTIRDSKFRRDRIVPLHRSATDKLRSYAETRDRLSPKPKHQTFSSRASERPSSTSARGRRSSR